MPTPLVHFFLNLFHSCYPDNNSGSHENTGKHLLAFQLHYLIRLLKANFKSNRFRIFKGYFCSLFNIGIENQSSGQYHGDLNELMRKSLGGQNAVVKQQMNSTSLSFWVVPEKRNSKLGRQFTLHACCTSCLDSSFLRHSMAGPSLPSGLCSLSPYRRDCPRPLLCWSVASLCSYSIFSISLTIGHYVILAIQHLSPPTPWVWVYSHRAANGLCSLLQFQLPVPGWNVDCLVL